MRRRLMQVGLLATLVGCAPDEGLPPSQYEDVEAFGEALFNDENLSLRRTQACATCHDPERAFTDGRTDAQGQVRAVSLGDDGASLGDRNAPALTYAALAPEFHVGTRDRHNKQNNHRLYMGPLGGQFWDGRATDLETQAGGPPVNPIEMGMPEPAAVVERLHENEEYRRALAQFFGPGTLDDEDAAYFSMTEAIAAYERTDVFSSFDSRYDRSLRGEAVLTFEELTGKAIFFSQFANCAVCHQLYDVGDPIGKRVEPFTGYEFHNIGVPTNDAVRKQNGVTEPDEGLHAHLDEPALEGAFKVPSLRNIAVTAPYMHNGVFSELRTVIEFYDHFTNADEREVNPETGEPWREPAFPDTVAQDLLEIGDPMSDEDIDALVCFLRALTDLRYEHLLPPGECGV